MLVDNKKMNTIQHARDFSGVKVWNAGEPWSFGEGGADAATAAEKRQRRLY